VVCSETVHHEEDILAALQAGLPVFVEKPMAGSAAAATRCAEAARKAGLTLQSGYFLRTNAALRRLHAELRAGRLGQVSEASMRFSHDGGYADWLDLDCWMTDPARACYGGFADEAVHVIDTLHWLLGPVLRGQAVTGNALGWPVDDHGAALLQFESGATGVVEAGWTDRAMRLEADLVGTTGWARLQGGRLEIGRRGQDTAEEEIALSPLDAGAGIEPFLDDLEGRQAPGLVPPEDAVRVNALLDHMGLALA
jgi:predicted dehydrogenase